MKNSFISSHEHISARCPISRYDFSFHEKKTEMGDIYINVESAVPVSDNKGLDVNEKNIICVRASFVLLISSGHRPGEIN